MVESFQEVNLTVNAVYSTALGELQAADLDLAEKFQLVCASPIMPEKASQFLEILYSRRESLSQPVREAAAAVGVFATQWGFWGLSEGGRGLQMVAHLLGAGTGEPPEPKYPLPPPPLEPEE